MRKNRFLAIIMCAAMLLSLGACSAKPVDEGQSAPVSQTDEVVEIEHQVITYFPNWNLENKPGAEGGEVASLAWDSISYINHAFWEIVPVEEPKESSFERREAGKEARTDFYIASTSPEFDIEDTTPSAVNPDMPRNHFAEYAAYSEQYPDVNILISIGGWSRSGYFSEMAYTAEGRTSFVNSCLALIEEYPWIDGFDIDWEYPGGSNDGERLPENDSDQGCPIWDNGPTDNANFALLCEQLKSEMAAIYGDGVKKLTACASASTGWTLPNQNWAPIAPYLDYINIMTYDLAGLWDKKTGFGTSYYGAASAVIYFQKKGIDSAKLNLGTPYYGTIFVMDGEIDKGMVIGAKITDKAVPGDTFTQKQRVQFESEAVSGYTTKIEDGKVVLDETYDNGGVGWHFGYSDQKRACYMFNDDTSSPYYNYFISYENELSLQSKIDAIGQLGIAGIIIWEGSQDTLDNNMTKMLGDNLLG